MKNSFKDMHIKIYIRTMLIKGSIHPHLKNQTSILTFLRVALRTFHNYACSRNLPFGGRARWDKKVHLPKRRMHESRHQCLFEQNVSKNQKERSVNFENKGSGVVYTQERYYQLTCPSKGTVAFNRVCLTWLQNYLFSLFYVFLRNINSIF